MRTLRTLAATGLLALVMLPLGLAFSSPASAAPQNPGSVACQRYQVLRGAEPAGVIILETPLNLAQIHCDGNVAAANNVPEPNLPDRQFAANDRCAGLTARAPSSQPSGQKREAQCIVDWVVYAKRTLARPQPCQQMLNAEWTTQTGTAAYKQYRTACAQAEGRNATATANPQEPTPEKSYRTDTLKGQAIFWGYVLATVVVVIIVIVVGAIIISARG